MSQGSVLAIKISSKWVPNRIIDAEGIRKPLDKHLGRYHSALRGILSALGRILSAIRSPKVGTTLSDLSTALQQQPAERGGERINLSQVAGIRGCRFEEYLLHRSTHPEAQGLGGF